MKKFVLPSLLVVVIALIVWSAYFYWENLRGAWTAFGPSNKDIAEVINTTGMPLVLPAGFGIEIFAKDLPGARVMTRDSFGNWWVSQTSEGVVSLLGVDQKNGKVLRHDPIFKGLNRPHGLAFDPENPLILYVAEEDKISRVGVYSEDVLHKIADLPSGGGHFTRTIGFGPEGRLHVSIGSSCNVCNESDERRAAIYSMNKDGSDFRLFARGLRNSVFFTWSEVDGKMWATDNGRDRLGDNLPPDEINIVEDGKNFGWPTCYGKNIHDADFDKNTYIRNPCMEPFEAPSHVDIQAHSAALGLAFIPESQYWPEEYWYNLIVALHGSWNRTTPTGYRLIRVKLDSRGNYSGTEDFVTGWLQNPRPGGGEVLGRPVQVVAMRDGAMYVTDDKAGVIYKITYNQDGSISGFEGCAAAGYPVMESYPRRCVVPGGRSFIEKIGNELDRADLIRLSTPRPNSSIKNPLIVEGEARGYWYFEADFPVRVLDGDGVELGVGIAQAQSDWMTEDFVSFRATINFTEPKSDFGTLLLQKSNASGLPEHDDEVRIPVKFVSGSGQKKGECFVAGCSGEICSESPDVASICIWREEFSCYKTAVCERQQSGECGWAQTEELASCVDGALTGSEKL